MFLLPRRKALSVSTVIATLAVALSSGIAQADFSKSIQVVPGIRTQAAATWYYANCTTSLGVGSYVVNTAPTHGAVSFGTVNAPLPGCPQGSPSLPAATAYYTWTDTTSTEKSDSFQLYYELNGGVAEVIDVAVTLAQPSNTACTITSTTEATVPGVPNSRTRIGVGEFVDLTVEPGPAKWTLASGKGTLSTTSGTTTTFTAPFHADSNTITATLTPGYSCSVNLTTVEPDGLQFVRLQKPGFGFHRLGIPFFYSYNVEMLAGVFMTPGDVSFKNILISELDVIRPHTTVPSDMLVTLNINNTPTNAWFIDCDYNQQLIGSRASPIITNDVWVYESPDKKQLNGFSWVHREVAAPRDTSGNVFFSKGQFLGRPESGGGFIPSVGEAAVLTVPAASSASSLTLLNYQQCLDDIPLEFQVVK